MAPRILPDFARKSPRTCGDANGMPHNRKIGSLGADRGAFSCPPNAITMKSILCSFVTASAMLIHAAIAAEPLSIASETQTNTICPVSGKPVDPAITHVYEDRTWSFANADSRDQFKTARESSLYQKLGGKAAIDAAVEAFYVKVLADERVKHFFDDVSMDKQRRKQKAFLSAALGSPVPWTGKDMRKAHANLDLTEVHFNAIAENLVATLKDLKISQELIGQVMAVVATTKDAVLNRPKAAQ